MILLTVFSVKFWDGRRVQVSPRSGQQFWQAFRLHCIGHSTLTDPALQQIPWFSLLPQSLPLLRALGWRVTATGDFILRTDVNGVDRSFRLGYDNVSILREWLQNFHRVDSQSRCARIAKSMRRHQGGDLTATGSALPAMPEHTFCIFQGHQVGWSSHGTHHLRHAALATGCSFWWKYPTECNQMQDDDPRVRCLCGRLRPSRAHLVWQCPRTTQWRPQVPPPCNRAKERLFAKPLKECPAPPSGSL